MGTFSLQIVPFASALTSAPAMPAVDTTLVPLAGGDVFITAEQKDSLRALIEVGGHSVNGFKRGENLIIAAGEKHVKRKKEAIVAQRVVHAFPLRGLESLITKETLEKGHEGMTFVVAGGLWHLLGFRYGSAIDAATLESFHVGRLLQLQECIRRFFKEREVDSPSYILIQLAGNNYKREIVLSKEEALSFANMDLCIEQNLAAINSGFPPHYLEMDHSSGWMNISMITYTWLVFSTFFYIVPYYTAPQIFGKMAAQSILLANLVVSGVFYVFASSKGVRQRDQIMARSADFYLSEHPEQSPMLAIMGQDHIRGFGKILTRELGWTHIGTGAALFAGGSNRSEGD